MILIMSSPDDIHATAVQSALNARGAENHILNLSEFPMSMDIGLSFATGAPGNLALRLKSGKRIDFAAVTSVWWRRPQGFGFPPSLTDPVNRAFAQQESDFAFKGMYPLGRCLLGQRHDPRRAGQSQGLAIADRNADRL